MNFSVEYTLNAQTEVEDAYLWIRERAPAAAEKWREELISKIEILGANPLRHSRAPESSRFPQEIRLMLFRKRRSQLRIYYTIEGQRVVILAVRRSARKPLEKDDLSL